MREEKGRFKTQKHGEEARPKTKGEFEVMLP